VGVRNQQAALEDDDQLLDFFSGEEGPMLRQSRLGISRGVGTKWYP
jgi:hypothetical protein